MKLRKKGRNTSPYRDTVRYGPSAERGLTSRQVQANIEAGLTNAASGKTSKTTGQIIRSNLFTYFNLIFFLLAGVLLYERSYNNLAFLGVVFANTAIGIVQELKAKRVLDKLQLVAAPESTAIRDGKPVQISLVSMMMIGVPSFFLALEPNTGLVHGRILRNVLFRALPAALTSVILVEWSLLFADAFQISAGPASTTAFFLYAIAACFMLFRVCKPVTCLLVGGHTGMQKASRKHSPS